MRRWERMYKDGIFAITTDQPSTIVRQFADYIPPGSRVADIGCGSGRNAKFLAAKGHLVEAFDIVDLGWRDDAYAGINFHETAAMDVPLPEESFGAIVMTRLVQYLPLEDVEVMIDRSAAALETAGLLFLSYAVEGGGHSVAEFDVPKFQHDSATIREMVKDTGLWPVYDTEQTLPPQNVTLDYDAVRTHDLVAAKLT